MVLMEGLVQQAHVALKTPRMGGMHGTSFPQAAQTMRSALIKKSVLSSAEHLQASLAMVPYCRPGRMTGGALWGDATGVGKASPSVIGLQHDCELFAPKHDSRYCESPHGLRCYFTT